MGFRVSLLALAGLFGAAISLGGAPADPLFDVSIHREYEGGPQGVRVTPLGSDGARVEIEFTAGGKVQHRAAVAAREFRHLTGWLHPELETLDRAARIPREERGRCGLGRFRFVADDLKAEGELCEDPSRRNFRETAAAARILREFGDRYWPVEEEEPSR